MLRENNYAKSTLHHLRVNKKKKKRKILLENQKIKSNHQKKRST